MTTVPQFDLGQWTTDGLITVSATAEGITAFTSSVQSGLDFAREVEKKTKSIRANPQMGEVELNIHKNTRYKSTLPSKRVIYWSIENGEVLFRGVFQSALIPLTI